MKKLLGIVVLGLLLTHCVSNSDETKKIIKNCAVSKTEVIVKDLYDKLVSTEVQRMIAEDNLNSVRAHGPFPLGIIDPDEIMSAEEIEEYKKKTTIYQNHITELEKEINKMYVLEKHYSDEIALKFTQIKKHCKNEYEKSPKTFKSKWKNF